jgi:acetyltransferase-like isoleucine patch superfamily enzyme
MQGHILVFRALKIISKKGTLSLKRLIIALLCVVHVLMFIFIFDLVFPALNLIPGSLLAPFLDFLDVVFYQSAPFIFLSLLIVFTVSLFIFVAGYSLCPKHRVEGTLTYTFSFILDLMLIEAALCFTFFGIIFSKEIANPFKVVLAMAYAPFFGTLTFFVLEKIIDVSFFFSDILREREEYRRLGYSVERKGKLTYIRIHTNDSTAYPAFHSILKAAPTLLIDQALFDIRKTGPISVFLKNAITGFFLAIFTRSTAWPRARLFFFGRLTGAKIGNNCFVGQGTTFDPILPDLVELEEDSGIGNGSVILTHSYIGAGRMTFAFGPVKICRYARLGARCVILPGVTIGEGALIAAGSVVAKDVPPYAFFVAAAPRLRKRGRRVT